MEYNFLDLMYEILQNYEGFEIIDDGRSDYLYVKYFDKSWKISPHTFQYKDFMQAKHLNEKHVEKYRLALFKSLGIEPKLKKNVVNGIQTHLKPTKNSQNEKFLVLDRTLLKQQIYDICKEAFMEFANSSEFKVIFNEAISKGVRKKVLNESKSDWIKGDKEAGKFLGVDYRTLRYRRKTGYYTEGVVWKKANYKLSRGSILWNKNALLKEMDY
ncbi:MULTISPECIES: hypothetical protein [unclassified Campylobacter]|uniref:hypothetical protein n=1 Tax=unclassified Campylobacter TaxID=2593542 RepID=UPI0022E9CF8A|nr:MULTISPECIES: hypothetical protein [unclassified Campylobacter]MDA3043405.1 hypothetical protein [Campylobacter sp. JMF_09 ED2]MDA3045158.1 hypothetical protein [Campylobacter sp. JMF_07 ED4]MDA3064242.1 hypothetical protein [Campylobacter sp. JMF_11 EL3]MDA3072458.1 hypothetical protein [Campylobacter sp. VBCF_03 NA9]MDA3075430.1 hypothetical protein [Campylobacter sp. JMF_05 ED3]